MTRRISVLAVCMVGLALVVAPTVGAQAVGAVKGRVIGENGQPLVGAEVLFRNVNTQQKMTLKADKNGEFFGYGLSHGHYEIRVVHKGQELVKIDRKLIYGGLQGNPSDINFRNNLDFNLSKIKREAAAAETPEQRAAREEQQKAVASYDRAVLFNREGKYEDALADLLPLAERDPTQWTVHAQMGVAYQNLKRYEEAEASYKKAIELQPSNPALYSNLGQVYVKMGKTEDARRMFDAAAQLSPEDAAGAYYNIAVTFINAGDMKSATDPLRKVVELEPNRAEAHYWLGMCLFNQSEYKTEGGEMKTIVPPGTREAFERYLQLQPNGPYAADSKQMLEAIDATVPASMRVKKK